MWGQFWDWVMTCNRLSKLGKKSEAIIGNRRGPSSNAPYLPFTLEESFPSGPSFNGESVFAGLMFPDMFLNRHKDILSF